MRKATKRLVKKIERRMDVLIRKEGTACGHEELMEDAMDYRVKMMRFLAAEIELMAEKAGLE